MASPVALDRVEAPVTMKACLMCVLAAFAGIFFDLDTGYISGTLAMPYFIHQFAGLPYDTPSTDFVTPASRQSFIVSILSAGTFTGAVIAGDLSDWYG